PVRRARAGAGRHGHPADALPPDLPDARGAAAGVVLLEVPAQRGAADGAVVLSDAGRLLSGTASVPLRDVPERPGGRPRQRWLTQSGASGTARTPRPTPPGRWASPIPPSSRPAR